MSNVVWEDFEKDQYGSIRGGLSGQYGDMPQEMHLKKLEQTCMYEREDQLDNYYRSTLKDRTLDAPSLASDLPRESQNQIRETVLSMRHSGAPTPAEPIHPDLFLGFTERDPRGYQTSGPDFRLYADQSKARGRYKDFVSDHASDWTVPESHRSELRNIRDVRKTINASRERMVIFDTSEDNRAVTFNSNTSRGSRVAQTTPDGVILDLNSAQEVNQRKDNTKLREDTIRIGYRQTGDHKFATAQYGIQSLRAHKANIWSTNYETETTHKHDIRPDEIKNRLLQNMMIEVGRRKYLDTYKTETDDTAQFQQSNTSANIIKKLTNDLRTAQTSTERSADTIDLGYLSENIKKVRVYDPISHDAVIVDSDIFAKVNEHKNITFVKKFDNNTTRRNVNTSEGKHKLPGDEVSVYVYSRKGPESGKAIRTRMEHKWYDTNFAPMYKGNHNKPGGLDSTYTHQGQGINPIADKVFDSYKKAPGRYWEARDNIDSSLEASDLPNDVMTTPHSHRPMAGRSRNAGK